MRPWRAWSTGSFPRAPMKPLSPGKLKSAERKGGGEAEPRLGFVRVRVGLLLCLRDGGPTRALADDVLQDVADVAATGPRADPVDDEAEDERDREEDEHPLHVAAQPGEEQLVLVAPPRRSRRRPCYPLLPGGSIRPRALAAVR